MAGFTFFFCSTLRNVSHFKSSRISCGRQHLLLIRREATRSQHSSSSQIFPLTYKFYHALSLQTTRLNQCINVGKVKVDHHSTKQYKPDFLVLDQTGTATPRKHWWLGTKTILLDPTVLKKKPFWRCLFDCLYRESAVICPPEAGRELTSGVKPTATILPAPAKAAAATAFTQNYFCCLVINSSMAALGTN